MDNKTTNTPQSMDYGKMNEQDAKDSGYTGQKAQAVDMAKPDVKGRPTGAYTDIAAARSDVVNTEHKTKEDAPPPRGEQAP